MKAKKIFLFISIFFQLLFSYNLLYAVVADSNHVVEFKQPDGTIFKGRLYGDEFLLWSETDDGYTIIKNFQTGYWCYAIKDKNDCLIPSDLVVGKANPITAGLIRHFKPSSEEFTRAEQLRQQRNQLLNIESSRGPKNLGLILIQFADALQDPVNNMGQVKTAPPNTPPNKWAYYSNSAYTNMIYTTGTYHGSGKHPENELVFGSMNDYYLEVSYGSVSIIGDVLNNIDAATGRYAWLQADYNKSHYEGLPDQNDDLIEEAILKAEAAHQSNPQFINPDDYYYICVLYAGPREGGSLWPHPTSILDHRAYNNSEKWPGGTYPHFNHIGIHCHEFAHCLGLHDKYKDGKYVLDYGLMGTGVYNGPNPPGRRGQCPAHVTCSGKIALDWMNSTPASNIHVSVNPLENSSANVYKLNIDEDRYFLLENRQYTGFDRYLPGHDEWAEGGLLIWYLNSTSEEKLIEADNYQSITGGDFFPGATDNTELSGNSNPTSGYDWAYGEIIYENCASGISVKNITISQPLNPIESDLAINEWAGNIRPWCNWSGDVKVIGPVIVLENGRLTFTESSIITFLNDSYIKSTGGIIVRESNVTFNPDIQLLQNGTTLIGQYSTLQQAITDASSGDEIKVNSDLVVTADVNLPQAQKLIISPGVTLQFAPGVSLNISGCLEAVGGWDDRITFECSNPASYWGGIKFQPDCDESSTITRCDISRATYGIFLDHVAPAIRYYNNISNCVYGIYGRYCAPDGFEHCDFDFNAYDGIHLENGNAVGNWHVPILYNSFGMNAKGLFLYDTDVKVWNENYFFNNSAYGIYASTECDVDMIDYDDAINTMEESDFGELYFQGYSSAYLGDLWLYDQYGATNYILGPQCRVKAYANTFVMARQVWWGVYWDYEPPSGMFIRDGSSCIRNEYPLDLEWPSLAKRHNTVIAAADQASSHSMSATDTSSFTALERAILLIYDKKYDAAAAICDSIILKTPDTKDAIHAQSLLGRIARRSGTSDFSAYLSRNVQQYADFEISAAAQRTQALLFAGQKDYHQAVSLLESINTNSKFKDSSINKHVLFDLIDLYHFDLKQDGVAKKYLEELATLFPNDDLVTIAKQKLNPVPGSMQSPQIQIATAIPATPLPTEFVLEQNHPNPFNSSTTIQYQLPQECHVTVTIYNMMGQKIRTLVQNQFHQAGSHIVSWDGNNELGQAVGSGVYCYQLRAGNFVDSKKLVIMK